MTFEFRYPKRVVPNFDNFFSVARSLCPLVICKEIEWAHGNFLRYRKLKLGWW